MEVNCEKCGTIDSNLTRERAARTQREHRLNHQRVRVSVIVTVQEDPQQHPEAVQP
jgi:hypothetical protein